MSSKHESDNHSDQLCEWIELGDARERLRAGPLADCPDCKEELEELLSLGDTLDRIGAEERLGLRESRESGISPPDGAVEEILRDVEPALNRKPGGFRARWLALVLAAGLLWFLWPALTGPGIDPNGPGTIDLGPTLGDTASDQILHPTQHGDPLDHFEWKPHPAPGSRYRIVVYSDGKRDRAIAASSIIDACEWTPSPEAIPTDNLNAIYWTVEVYPLGASAPDEFFHSGRIDL